MNLPHSHFIKLINQLIEDFCYLVCDEKIDIYNEFSLQHELGIFLRQHIQDHKIRFEKNINSFGYEKNHFEKREIDISIIDSNAKLVCALELKFPRNGQVPEQMFSFCKDIAFLEQLKSQGMQKGFFVAFVDDKSFFSGKDHGIYSFFRGKKPIQGAIEKPTGEKGKTIQIVGPHIVDWKNTNQPLTFCIVEI